MHIRSADLSAWLRTRVTATGAEGLIVPLTGTLQAAVVARLCQLAAGEAVLGALQPAGAEARAQARALAQHLQLPVIDVECRSAAPLAGELAPQLERLRHRQGASGDAERAGAALTSRLSMAAMYFLADSLNCLIAGTLDRTDLTLGAFTKHGEAAVDLLPLGNVFRRDVVALARDLELPPGFVDFAQSAGEAVPGTGLTHRDLESYLGDGPDAVAPAAALKVERLMRESDRKRAAAEMPDPD
jgi:NAD+ synthase